MPFSYDLWISELSSVEERQHYPFCCIGLDADVSGESGVMVEPAVMSLSARV